MSGYAAGESVLVLGEVTQDRDGVRLTRDVQVPLNDVHVVSDIPASSDVGELPVGLLLLFRDDMARRKFAAGCPGIPMQVLG